MKVVHISTMDTGGAANAAIRIHLGLLEQNIDSHFISLNKNNNIPKSYRSKKTEVLSNSLMSRLVRKLKKPLLQSEINKELISGIDGNYEIFSFPYTDYRVENEILLADADIIHLHWISNFINFPTFFKAIDKPIVWTFHDMNPILGAFHYTGEFKRNPKELIEIDKSFKERKYREIAGVKNLHLVTYSKWLIDYVKKEKELQARPISYILSGLDLNIYKPFDKCFSREFFNLPKDKKIILFVCESISNYRKGFDILINALNEQLLNDDVCMVAVGATEKNNLIEQNIVYVGKIMDERLLSLLYSAADVFVIPSREEALGLVALESMACGTPVIAFSNGGLRDVVKTGFNGILVDRVDSKNLGIALKDFIRGKISFDSAAIRKYAVENLDKQIQAKKYVEIYKSMLQ